MIVNRHAIVWQLACRSSLESAQIGSWNLFAHIPSKQQVGIQVGGLFYSQKERSTPLKGVILTQIHSVRLLLETFLSLALAMDQQKAPVLLSHFLCSPGFESLVSCKGTLCGP